MSTRIGRPARSLRASWRRAGCALGVVLAASAASAPARADDAIAAQALFDQAKKAMTAHNYAEACPKFEESLRLQSALGTELNLALCYEQAGRLASAWSTFLEVSTKARGAGQAERAKIAHDHAAALVPKLSNLMIEVPPPSRVTGLEVRRDGALAGAAEWETAIPADAGQHTIEASAPGRKPWSQKVTVTEGATTTHVSIPELEVVPAPVATPAEPATSGTTPGTATPATATPGADEPRPGNGLRIAAYVAGGVGLAGLAVGGVFGVLSILRHNDAEDTCRMNPCSDSNGVQLWSDAVNFGNISTVAFIAGGVATAAGIALFIAAPKSSEHPAPGAQLVLGPGNVALKGAW